MAVPLVPSEPDTEPLTTLAAPYHPAESADDSERILEAEEIAAVLVAEPAHATPPPPRKRIARPIAQQAGAYGMQPSAANQNAHPGARQADTHKRVPLIAADRTTGTVTQHAAHQRAPLTGADRSSDANEQQTAYKRMPATAATLSARLEAAEAELGRLRRQMRARDAYLAELERELHASTSELQASGIGSLEDAHKLLGRVRGQAFRIAELESELRQMEQRLSRFSRLLPEGYTS